jgi:salicylate hydroxylase
MSVRSAIVVGAGIGGLTAALALARKGVRVSVLEQAPELGEVGAGIQIGPNASRVLFGLGLGEALAERAFHPEALEARSWKRGRRLLRSPLGPAITARYGAPYLNLHRADLLAVLAEAAMNADGIDVRFANPIARIEQTRDVVTATTTGENSFTAEVCIGADGIKSLAREVLFGPEAPRFTGCVAWRGLVPAEAVRHADVRPVASNWMGPGSHFVHYYVRGGALVNFVGIVEKTGWEIESWTERGEKSELLSDFAGWHPTVRALIEAADPDACFKWALFDRDPLPRWSEGRVALLGDACHPSLPFMAQGACMAIEDAVVLADCLAADDDVPAALGRYESLRVPRTAAIQLGSRRNARLYHLRGPKAWLRNAAMPLLGRSLAKRSDQLFAYDAFAAANEETR